MKIEKINYLLELIIDGKLQPNRITNKDLAKYNFSSNEIDDLIKDEYLIKKNSYLVVNIKDLFIKGKKMFNKRNLDRAYLCFKKCYELDSTDEPTNFYLFYYSISDGNYDKAFQYFETMNITTNPNYINDNNFYLYMLNFITNVPDKYSEKLKNMRIKDITVDLFDNRYSSIDSANKIRIAMYEKKFSYANTLFSEIIQGENVLVYNKLIEILINRASDKQKAYENDILNLINKKKYEDIVNYLVNLEEKQNLSEVENWILKLAMQIKEIKTTLQVPEKQAKSHKSFNDVIENKNYFLALKLSYEYNRKYNIDNQNDIIYRLLDDLCNLIEQINVANAKFSHVVSYLNNQNYKQAIDVIRLYLKYINQLDKESLVISQIKLDIMMEDKAYKQTIHTLNNISNLDFDMNIVNKKVEKIDSLVTSENINIAKFEEVLAKKTEPKQKNYLEGYVKDLHNKLLINKGIIMLENITKEEYHKIYNIVKSYSDLVLFYVGSGKNRKYILRYRIRTLEKNDYRKIVVLGLQAYRAGKYDVCIEYNLQLLQYGKPNASVYEMLGRCYLAKQNYELAIMYLTVATELGKKDGFNYDFTEIINVLREKLINDFVSNPKKLTLVNNKVNNYE